MLYHLFFPLASSYKLFNVFKYLTFRSIYAMITALVVAFIIGPWVIRRLEALQARQVIRTDGPESHLKKQGTPTMGGMLIIFAVLLAWYLATTRFVVLDRMLFPSPEAVSTKPMPHATLSSAALCMAAGTPAPAPVRSRNRYAACSSAAAPGWRTWKAKPLGTSVTSTHASPSKVCRERSAQKSSADTPVAILMKHMAGNMCSRFVDFLTTDGEKPTRHRDQEFIIDANTSRAENAGTVSEMNSGAVASEGDKSGWICVLV